MAQPSEQQREYIAQIKARDALLRRRGFAEFTYTSKKLGFSSTRRLILNFEKKLVISFLDKDGIVGTEDISCVLSMYQTETPGF
jgi:hypothetical protein